MALYLSTLSSILKREQERNLNIGIVSKHYNRPLLPKLCHASQGGESLWGLRE